jgi:putative intracellular protease/amidase
MRRVVRRISCWPSSPTARLRTDGVLDSAVGRSFEYLGDVEVFLAVVEHGSSTAVAAALVNVTLSDGTLLVAGKKLAAFTDSEEHAVQLQDVVPFLLASTLVERGATHQAAPDWSVNVVVDGCLVTGQNPQSASGVGAAMRTLLVGAA